MNARGTASAPIRITLRTDASPILPDGTPAWFLSSCTTSVANLGSVDRRVCGDDVSKIEEALKRSAELDVRRITVEVDGGQVRLSGSLRSSVKSTRLNAPRGRFRRPFSGKLRHDRSLAGPAQPG